MKILGIDPGKKTGYAMLRFEKDKEPHPIAGGILEIESSPRSKGKEVVDYMVRIEELLLDLKPNLIAVEHPAGGYVSMVLPTYGRMLAVSILPHMNIDIAKHLYIRDCIEVFPPKWKKVVVGKGNASKKFVKEYVLREYSDYAEEYFKGQDQIDAFCIALWAAKTVVVE